MFIVQREDQGIEMLALRAGSREWSHGGRPWLLLLLLYLICCPLFALKLTVTG